MNRLNQKYYYYAEITIEADSPLVLASGKSGNFFDVELVRDANDLPAIPGTSIAGILRHAIQKEYGEETAKYLFGFQTKDEGSRSSVETSWAYIHDSKNNIHKSFFPKDEIEKDAILKELAARDNSDFMRDHVRLSHKGTTLGTGKFDRSFVPRGSRFTFSIGLWSESDKNENWEKLLNLLSSPSFRIGASGRAGYGKIKVVDIKIPSSGKEYFDLSSAKDLETFRECKESYKPNAIDSSLGKMELTLSFPLGFRVGGGSTSFLGGKHPADMLPYSERIITWKDKDDHSAEGTIEDAPKITVPASAIKGALRHRAAFHLARIKNKWTEAFSNEKEDEGDYDGLSKLFGYAADENNNESKGQAGKIWFTDLYLNQNKTYPLSRNSIDRFTGGTMKGALFQEENVYVDETYKTVIYYDTSIKKTKEYQAFEWAVDDLQNGRLALGGGSGHGLGFNKA